MPVGSGRARWPRESSCPAARNRSVTSSSTSEETPMRAVLGSAPCPDLLDEDVAVAGMAGELLDHVRVDEPKRHRVSVPVELIVQLVSGGDLAGTLAGRAVGRPDGLDR